LFVAAVFHLLLFVLAPPFNFKPYEVNAEEAIEVVEIPAEIVIPPPPKEIPRPPVKITVSNDARESDDVPETSPDLLDHIPPPPTFSASSTAFLAFDELPVLVFFVQPAYPELAREAGIEGRVVFKVTVGTDGRVLEAIVHTSDVTDAMERAALKSVRKARFKPAKQRNVPVKSVVYMPYQFRLRSDCK